MLASTRNDEEPRYRHDAQKGQLRKHLNRISIGRRISLVLGLILLFSAGSSGFAVFQLREQVATMNRMIVDNVQNERDLADWLRQTTAGVQRAAAIAKSSDPSLIAYFAPATALSISTTTELQKRIEQNVHTSVECELLADAGKLRSAYLAARDKVNALKKSGDSEGSMRAFDEAFEPNSKAYLAAVQKLTESQRAQLPLQRQRANVLQLCCWAVCHCHSRSVSAWRGF